MPWTFWIPIEAWPGATSPVPLRPPGCSPPPMKPSTASPAIAPAWQTAAPAPLELALATGKALP